jgi:CBS domain-containing protein
MVLPCTKPEVAMNTVDQLLKGKNRRLLSIAPGATVFEALKLMAEHDVGALVVLEGDRLVGIFSERDYARKVVLFGKFSKETAVRDIMTPRVLCVRPDQTVDQCMALMTEHRVRHLPVVDAGRITGVVSIGDVVKDLLSEQQVIISQLESYIHM